MRHGNMENAWLRLGVQGGLALALLISCLTLPSAQAPASLAAGLTTFDCNSLKLELRSGNTEHNSIRCRRLGLCPTHTFPGLNNDPESNVSPCDRNQVWNLQVRHPLHGLELAPEPPPPRRTI